MCWCVCEMNRSLSSIAVFITVVPETASARCLQILDVFPSHASANLKLQKPFRFVFLTKQNLSLDVTSHLGREAESVHLHHGS